MTYIFINISTHSRKIKVMTNRRLWGRIEFEVKSEKRIVDFSIKLAYFKQVLKNI